MYKNQNNQKLKNSMILIIQNIFTMIKKCLYSFVTIINQNKYRYQTGYEKSNDNM